MAIRWRKRVLAYRPQLYWLGIGALVAGTVLMCVGGYWMARSPEFLAAYRIRKADAVYYGQRIGSQEQAYYQQEVARLQHGATLALPVLRCSWAVSWWPGMSRKCRCGCAARKSFPASTKAWSTASRKG